MQKISRSAESRATRHHSVRGEVRVFQVQKPWIYVPVPRTHTERTRHLADRGLVAIEATLGSSHWKTSLMPMGDGTQFIPLPGHVRKQEGIGIGDRITLSYTLRKR
jgi:hypothetical protein